MTLPGRDSRALIEVAAFATVGVAASLTHLVASVIAIEQASLTAWVANIIGFLIALPVSYFGHAFMTFQAKHNGREKSVTGQSFRRFSTLAVTAFSLNQLSVVIFVEWLGLAHRPVFFFTIFGVAGFIFLASKFWAFRGGTGANAQSAEKAA